VSYVHRFCLDQWRQSGFSLERLTKCPTCKFEYKTKNSTDKYELQKTIFWSLARKISLIVLLFFSCSISISPVLGNWAVCALNPQNVSESDNVRGWVCLDYFPSTEQAVWKLFYRGVYTSFVLLGLYAIVLGIYLWITGKYFDDFFDVPDLNDPAIHNNQNEVIHNNNDTANNNANIDDNNDDEAGHVRCCGQNRARGGAEGTHFFGMGCLCFSDSFCGKYGGSGRSGVNYIQILCGLLLAVGVALVFVAIFKCIYFTIKRENRKWKKEITKIHPVVCLNSGIICEKILQSTKEKCNGMDFN